MTTRMPPSRISTPQTGVGMAISKKQIAQRAAELQPTRDAMASAMRGYFQQHGQAVEAADAVRQANKAARASGAAASPMPATLPPMGVAATVGLGKSRGVVPVAEAAHAKGLPIVVLVPNHKLAQEHAAGLSHLGAVVYQGRRKPNEGKPGGPPVDPGSHACYRMVPVAEAGDRNHRPAQGFAASAQVDMPGC